MRELRLLPAAGLAWAVVGLVVAGYTVWAIVAVAAVGLVAWGRGHGGQGLLCTGISLAAGVVALVRRARARGVQWPEEIAGTIVGESSQVAGSGYVVTLRVPGVPGDLPVFISADANTESLARLSAGAQLYADVRISPADGPSLTGVVANATDIEVTAPTGWTYTWASQFRSVVDATVGQASQGLIPGMVLGDTSGQSPAEQQVYIDAGLSHLSAVSGANVATVSIAAVMVCRALALGPRVQAVVAGVLIIGFAALVGLEPSVLRATVAGVAALLAVMDSARMEPMHALCLGVIGLVIWDSELAVNFGFALSVAATAALVALFPLIYRVLAPVGWPDIIVRAVAVAVAADIATMPIVALMTGEVSTVSVLANFLVGPVTAPITVVGLLAVCALKIPLVGTVLAAGLVKLIEPLSWWIYHVAQWVAALPNAKLGAHPGVVVVAYAWIICAWWYRRVYTSLVLIAGCALAGTGGLPAREIPLDTLRVYSVETEQQLLQMGTVPAGTQVIVVTDPSGLPRDRASRTPEGIPVIYPQRDGPAHFYTDGTVRVGGG